MERIQIYGGKPLKGKLYISGSKNASLPIIAASLLFEDAVKIYNTPKLDDIISMLNILNEMGSHIILHDDSCIEILNDNIKEIKISQRLSQKIRASILFLGGALPRYKKIKLPNPGGCVIGERPINYHLIALEKMGAKIEQENEYIVASIKNRLQGCEINFPTQSVTATENIIMSASLAKGKTVIKNAAFEPEIDNLITFLNNGGAKIQRISNSVIEIEGVEKLTGASIEIIPDRIETATYLACAIVPGSDIKIKKGNIALIQSVVDSMRKQGFTIEENQDQDISIINDVERLIAVNIQTEEYPGFPTDMQAQFTVLNTIAQGESIVTESIFENRFNYVDELIKFGAKIEKLNSNQIKITGQYGLKGAIKANATDLRASASLIIAGLAAKDKTEVFNVYHIDRGYECIEEKLQILGANIKRIYD